MNVPNWLEGNSERERRVFWELVVVAMHLEYLADSGETEGFLSGGAS